MFNGSSWTQLPENLDLISSGLRAGPQLHRRSGGVRRGRRRAVEERVPARDRRRAARRAGRRVASHRRPANEQPRCRSDRARRPAPARSRHQRRRRPRSGGRQRPRPSRAPRLDRDTHSARTSARWIVSLLPVALFIAIYSAEPGLPLATLDRLLSAFVCLDRRRDHDRWRAHSSSSGSSRSRSSAMTNFILIVGLILLAAAVVILIRAVATPARSGAGREPDRRLRLPGLRVSARTLRTADGRTPRAELPAAVGAWLESSTSATGTRPRLAGVSSRPAGTRPRRPLSWATACSRAIAHIRVPAAAASRRESCTTVYVAGHHRRRALRVVPAVDGAQPEDAAAPPLDRPRAARADRPARRHGRGGDRLQRLPAAGSRRSSTARSRRSSG